HEDERPKAESRRKRGRSRMHGRHHPKPRRRFRDFGGRDKTADGSPGRPVEPWHGDRVEVSDRYVEGNATAKRMGDEVRPSLADLARLGRAQSRFGIENAETCPDLFLRGKELALKRRITLGRGEKGFEHRLGGAI